MTTDKKGLLIEVGDTVQYEWHLTNPSTNPAFPISPNGRPTAPLMKVNGFAPSRGNAGQSIEGICCSFLNEYGTEIHGDYDPQFFNLVQKAEGKEKQKLGEEKQPETGEVKVSAKIAPRER